MSKNNLYAIAFKTTIINHDRFLSCNILYCWRVVITLSVSGKPHHAATKRILSTYCNYIYNYLIYV